MCPKNVQMLVNTLPSMSSYKNIATVLCNIDSSFFCLFGCLFSSICFFFVLVFFCGQKEKKQQPQGRKLENPHKKASNNNKKHTEQQKRQKQSNFTTYSPTVRKRWFFKE